MEVGVWKNSASSLSRLQPPNDRFGCHVTKFAISSEIIKILTNFKFLKTYSWKVLRLQKKRFFQFSTHMTYYFVKFVLIIHHSCNYRDFSYQFCSTICLLLLNRPRSRRLSVFIAKFLSSECSKIFLLYR